MKIFKCENTSPYVTLSIEECLVSDPDMKGDILYIYQHNNAVIIGKNQNAYEEIKKDYIDQNNIELARRVSGGGAVYHDLGNVNFSFITDYNKKSGYKRFLNPIIEFLNSLGLKAEFHGRNDLLCNGAKISGNAQFIYKNRIVSHGTLLFDVDLTKLSNALNPSKLKFQSKNIQSVRQRVTNIAKELDYSMDVNEFIDKLIKFFVENNKATYEELPLDKYQSKLKELIELRKSNEWIYNKKADFSAQSTAKFNGGILSVKINVEHNIIDNIVFEGDFLSKKDVSDVEKALIGCEYNKEEFTKILERFELEEYFGGIEKREILELVFG
ncbi:lipoate--protein ligase [Mycoplasmopsis ciconiae]|uniref:lipoate--protein ligase n=1 Tax=Mycoplasmopsis ciconiae TaxID=561067 RepID=A0ABU7MLD8_9BACT|nr:lipoate--protein ligase [Mycoplasmopsis ciconiae]